MSEYDSGMKTYGYDDLAQWPEPEWAIKEVMQAEGLGMIHGEPGTYKTFIMLDVAMSLALGQPRWMGRHVDRKRRCLYVLAEGVQFFKDRMDSWKTLHDEADCADLNENLRLYPDAVDILNEDQVQAVIATAKALGVEVVFFDTYSRMIAGKDENATEVATQAIKHLDRVHKAIKGFVWLVHHDNKGGGYRGNSSLNGALDHRIQVIKGEVGDVILKCAKNKNAPEWPNIQAVVNSIGPSAALTLSSPVAWTPSPRLQGMQEPINMDNPFA